MVNKKTKNKSKKRNIHKLFGLALVFAAASCAQPALQKPDLEGYYCLGIYLDEPGPDKMDISGNVTLNGNTGYPDYSFDMPRMGATGKVLANEYDVRIDATSGNGVTFLMYLTFEKSENYAKGTVELSVQQTSPGWPWPTRFGDADLTRGNCGGWKSPGGTPPISLPFAAPSPNFTFGNLTAGQQFNLAAGHSGLDFVVDKPATGQVLYPFIAPMDGFIDGIQVHAITPDNWAVNVGITYNDSWGTYMAFEVCTADPNIIADQRAAIGVQLNQIVSVGDSIGSLLADAGIYCNYSFPHVHWGVTETVNGVWVDHCPIDYVSRGNWEIMTKLYSSFGVEPVCLP